MVTVLFTTEQSLTKIRHRIFKIMHFGSRSTTCLAGRFSPVATGQYTKGFDANAL